MLGDRSVGKSAVVITHSSGQFPEGYIPNYFDNYPMHLMVDEKPYQLTVCEAICRDEYDRVRPQTYPDTDVFLILYSSVHPASFEKVRQKWYPEVTFHCPNTPIVLVATKIDIREQMSKSTLNLSESLITYEQGFALSKEIGASKFIECSAATQQGLKDCFEECIRASLAPKPWKKKSCTLL